MSKVEWGRGAVSRKALAAECEVMRKVPEWNRSRPITPETFERLFAVLERVYPGRVRRAVDVMPVAVNKTIDNEDDALETIRRAEEHLAKKREKAPRRKRRNV